MLQCACTYLNDKTQITRIKKEIYFLSKDLLSLKEIEGYTLIECEEHGPSSVTTPSGDILTVETSLQDLEFGFSVVKSTQKVYSCFIDC